MSTPPASVLIVSADVALQACVRDALGADGYTLVAVDTVTAALAHLTTAFTLILATSPAVPGDGRWDEIERLQLAAGSTPVVLLSESGAVPFAGYRERGFAGLIVTPCDPDDLSTILRPMLRTQEVAA